MITDLSNATSEIVKFSLNMLSMQHAYIANNIANSNTSGYHPSKINFEQLLEEVSSKIANENYKAVLEQAGSDLHTGLYVTTSNVEGVELDSELVALSTNTIQYKALLSALSTHGELMKIVLNSEGGR